MPFQKVLIEDKGCPIGAQSDVRATSLLDARVPHLAPRCRFPSATLPRDAAVDELGYLPTAVLHTPDELLTRLKPYSILTIESSSEAPLGPITPREAFVLQTIFSSLGNRLQHLVASFFSD